MRLGDDRDVDLRQVARLIAVAMVATTLLAAAPALADHAYTPALDRLRVDAGEDPDRRWHYFDVETTPYVDVRLVVMRGGRVLLDRTRTADAAGYIEGLRYHWSCRLPGRHAWSVTASDDHGNTLSRTGRFTVRRCFRERDRISRGDVVRYVFGAREDRYTDEPTYLYQVECPASANRRARATRSWRCVIVWVNYGTRRVCARGYVFWRVSVFLFGDPDRSRWHERALTRPICRRY